MRTICTFLLLLLFFDRTFSQTKSTGTNARNSLYYAAGRAFTGSGDLSGLNVATGYSKDFKHWNVTCEIAINHFSGSRLLYYNTPLRPNELTDGSIRYNTFGIQANFIGSYRIIRKQRHSLNVGLGPVLRYQSTSIPDDYSILFPAATNLPVPVLYFQNREPQNSFDFGGVVKLSYNYYLSRKINVGAFFSFQTDTNEDNISATCLSVGYVL